MEYTIAEEFTLPSEGKVYSKPVNPVIKLRSMTTEDEMRRLSRSDRPYKNLCEMIDSCIVGDKPGISTYDMCLGDYQYLLHRLRVVTYGPEYEMQSVCPFCGHVNKVTINLDDIPVFTYSDEIEKYLEIKLPKSEKVIKVRMQTPRIVDDITVKADNMKKKNPNISDPTVMLMISSLIEKVDGNIIDSVKLENMIRKLPMADTNYLLKNAEKLNSSIGIDPIILFGCDGCGVDYTAPFRITPEFFGPSINF